MKKILSVLIAVILFASVPAFAENWYLDRAVVMAERIGVLAGDKVYIEMYMTTPDDIAGIIEGAAGQSFSDPVRARMLVMPSEKMTANLLEWIGAAEGAQFERMSVAAKEELMKKLPGIFASAINARRSATWLAASTVLCTVDTHVMPEGFEPCVLLLEYEGDYSVAVSFAKTGTNTVSASASMIPSGTLESLTEDLPFAARVIFNGLFREIEVG